MWSGKRKEYFRGKIEAFSRILYLVMGWLLVFYFHTLNNVFNYLQMNLLITDGIFFGVGIVFTLGTNFISTMSCSTTLCEVVVRPMLQSFGLW
jgi:channel protein (hemolysin III family)